MADPKDQRGKIYEHATRICCHVFGYGSVFAGILSFFFVFLALYQVSNGIWKCFAALMPASQVETHSDLHDGHHVAVMTILGGLELLLLAPLPYLFLSSFAYFVSEWESKDGVSEQTNKKLHAAKILLYGSFFGLLCLDFIGKTVVGKTTLLDGPVELGGLLLLALLILGLEKIHLKNPNH